MIKRNREKVIDEKTNVRVGSKCRDKERERGRDRESKKGEAYYKTGNKRWRVLRRTTEVMDEKAYQR